MASSVAVNERFVGSWSLRDLDMASMQKFNIADKIVGTISHIAVRNLAAATLVVPDF